MNGTQHAARRQLAGRSALPLLGLILLGGLLPIALPPPGARNAHAEGALSVQISEPAAAVAAAEWVEFHTVLRNHGTAATPSLIAHLAIAALDAGRYVDPEDWSPQRTQYLPSVQPGESIRLAWRLRALIEGRFVAFVTVVSTEESFPPVVSAPLRLQVAAHDLLPLEAVIPVIAGVPLLAVTLLLFTAAYARRRMVR